MQSEKILHVIPRFRHTEGSIVAAALCAKAQHKQGYSIQVMANDTPQSSKSFNEKLCHPDIATAGDSARLSLGSQTLQISKAAKRRIMHANRVHIHGLWEGIQHQSARFALKHGKSVIVSPHGMLTQWSMGQATAKKMAYARLFWAPLKNRIHLHYITEWEREESDNPKNLLNVASSTIPLPVDTDAIQHTNDCGETEQRVTSDHHGPTVLFVGRVHPGKGVEHLLNAAPFIKTPNVLLKVVGPNNSEFGNSMRQKAEQVSNTVKTVFLGPIYPPNLYRAMRSATMVCIPSDHENFGLTVVEAMASGGAVLASDQVAVAAECEKQGGVEICDRTPTELASTIDRMLASPDSTDRLRKTGKQIADARYSMHAVGESWAELFQNQLAI